MKRSVPKNVWKQKRADTHTHRSCLFDLSSNYNTLFFCAGAVRAADCTCCVLMSGTGFVAPADLPLSDEEDVEQAVFACLFFPGSCVINSFSLTHSPLRLPGSADLHVSH